MTATQSQCAHRPGLDEDHDGWSTCPRCRELGQWTRPRSPRRREPVNPRIPSSPAEPADDQQADAALAGLRARMVAGGAFIHDAPAHVPALWGRGDEVLWAEGEPLILTGPTGVGKTTLGGQVVAGRLGLLDEVIGYPVQPGRRVLYLAMDRPKQISKALHRRLSSWPRDVLDERLTAWSGPPPADLARNPTLLRRLASAAGADTVVIDSLKDAAIKLSDEETGQGISRAMNHCVADGVEVLAFHHQTKRSAGGQGKPNSIADVYGSAWITAGAGSVLLLWGAGGDLVVELSHLKQPADTIGPLQLVHDHITGRTRLVDDTTVDVVELLATPCTVKEIAMRLNVTDEPPTRNAIERARRKLDRLVEDGTAIKRDAPAGGSTTYVRAVPKGFTQGGHAPPVSHEGVTES